MISPPRAAAVGLIALPLLWGCTTYRETQPAATATQQLLEAHAAEIAADKLAAALPAHDPVFIDASHFKGDNSDYALSAIRAACMKHGMTLAADAKSSKVTVEVRLGALSIDQKDAVLGIPSMTLPVPGTLTALPIPELAIYAEAHRTGKAEFSAFAYETANGAPIAAVGPFGGKRDLRDRTVLLFFHSGQKLEPAGVVDKKK